MRQNSARSGIINAGSAAILLIALGTAAAQRRGTSQQQPAVTTPSSSSAQVTVPKMPPMSSNAKRDAAPPADTATKEQIKSQLKAQITAAIPRIAGSTGAALTPEESDTPEVKVLKSQKVFVDTFRTQGRQTKGAIVQAQ